MKTRTDLLVCAAALLVMAALPSACAGDDARDGGNDSGGAAGSTHGVGGGAGEGGRGQAGTGSAGRGGQGGGTGGDKTGSGGKDPGTGGGGRGGSSGSGHSGGATGSGGTGSGSSGGSKNTGGTLGGTGGVKAGSGGSSSTGGACPSPEEDKFSFFLISYKAVQRESGNELGFGGNLGGIEGADAICQRVAEYASPCQKNKVWHAFLSTSKVDAIDRIGKGPWYDRMGRQLAKDLTDLVLDRPGSADPAIKNDFPNEDGVPNHAPQGTQQVDNHEILTGSGLDGRLYKQTGGTGMPFGDTVCGNNETWSVEKATCWDWTTSEEKGCPRVGHSWPRQGSGTNWISVWNEGGCAPGGNLSDQSPGGGGLDGTRRVGSAGGYGGFYCFAVMPAN